MVLQGIGTARSSDKNVPDRFRYWQSPFNLRKHRRNGNGQAIPENAKSIPDIQYENRKGAHLYNTLRV